MPGAEPMRAAAGNLRASLPALPRDRGREYWVALTDFYPIMI